MHRKIKTGIETAKVKVLSPELNKKQRRNNIVAIISILIFFLVLPLTCHHKNDDLDKLSASFVHVDDKEPSAVKVLIVAGHGSIDKGVYLTPGKQSPKWSNGLKIYEGYSTHMLAHSLSSSLSNADIDVGLITPDAVDLTLYQRAFLVNSLYRLDERIIVISLHHNAQPYSQSSDYRDHEGYYGWMQFGATGTEVFTSHGQTASDEIAEIVIRKLREAFPNMKMRTDLSDGDLDKEAGFYILKKTASPALLIEWGFMTSYQDCEMIADPISRQKFVEAVTSAIVEYNRKINLRINNQYDNHKIAA